MAQPQVLGDFRTLREIGRGGMAVVYHAIQESLDRPVALKVLHPHVTQSPRAVERFYREAGAAARLHHPFLAPIYAIGEEGGLHFFALEYVDGESLADRLPSAQEPLDDHPLPGLEQVVGACELAAKVADALHYAHESGLVHRDVKPQNIMVTTKGEPRLVDFGLARDLADGPSSLTITGEFMGTPYYVSPEQVLGGRADLDRRTDVYSLGVTLYQLLTLRVPFPGEAPQEVFAKIVSKPVPAPRQYNAAIPVDLEKILLTATARDPDRRYATADDFARDLRRFLAEQPVAARSKSSWQRSREWFRAHPILGTLLLAALAAGVGYGLRLTAKTTTLDLEGPPGTVVQIGADEFTLPLANPLRVEPGTYDVEFRHPDRPPQRQRVHVEAGDTRIARMQENFKGALFVELAGEFDQAFAELTPEREGAEEQILKLPTSSALELEPGAYRLRLLTEGFESPTHRLRVDEQKTTRLRVAHPYVEECFRFRVPGVPQGSSWVLPNHQGGPPQVGITSWDEDRRLVIVSVFDTASRERLWVRNFEAVESAIAVPVGQHKPGSRRVVLALETSVDGKSVPQWLGLDADSGATLWQSELPHRPFGMPLVGDRDQDQEDEIYLGTRSGALLEFDRDGGLQKVRQAQGEMRAPIRPTAIRQLGRYHGLAVLCEGTDGWFAVLNPEGEWAGTVPAPGGRTWNSPANFPHARRTDVLRVTETGASPEIRVYGVDGGQSYKMDTTHQFEAGFASPPVFIDLTGDGRHDAIFASVSGQILAYDLTGSDTSAQWTYGGEEDHWHGPLILQEAGPEQPPVVLGFRRSNIVQALHARTGRPLWRKALSNKVAGTPTFFDLDEDGVQEVLLATSSGEVLALKPPDPDVLWEREFPEKVRLLSEASFRRRSESESIMVVGERSGPRTLASTDGSQRPHGRVIPERRWAGAAGLPLEGSNDLVLATRFGLLMRWDGDDADPQSWGGIKTSEAWAALASPLAEFEHDGKPLLMHHAPGVGLLAYTQAAQDNMAHELWQYSPPNSTRLSHYQVVRTISGNAVLVLAQDHSGSIAAIEIATGQVLWHLPASDWLDETPDTHGGRTAGSARLIRAEPLSSDLEILLQRDREIHALRVNLRGESEERLWSSELTTDGFSHAVALRRDPNQASLWFLGHASGTVECWDSVARQRLWGRSLRVGAIEGLRTMTLTREPLLKPLPRDGDDPDLEEPNDSERQLPPTLPHVLVLGSRGQLRLIGPDRDVVWRKSSPFVPNLALEFVNLDGSSDPEVLAMGYDAGSGRTRMLAYRVELPLE